MRSVTFASRSAAVLFILFVLAGVLPAQQSTFQDTTSVVVVDVPVTVMRRDEPLRELTADNFEVLDDGKKQKIVGFEAVDLRYGDKGAEGEVPGAARRHFLLLFDLAFTQPDATVRAREIARTVLDELHPTDLVAVGSYSSVRGLITVIGFTGDRRQAELAIDSFGLPELLEGEDDPLGLVLGHRRDAEDWDAQADEKVRQVLLQANAAEQVNNEQTRILALGKNLEGISDMLGQLEGRKHILYLSEGFDSRLLTGGQSLLEAQTTNQAVESGAIWDVNSESRFGNTQVQNTTSGMQEAFRRNDCVLHTIDLSGGRARSATRDMDSAQGRRAELGLNSAEDRGRSAAEPATDFGSTTDDGFSRRSNESGLVNLSRNTGGMHFRNIEHLKEGLSTLLERYSLTYVLTFQPSQIAFDGASHKIRVKLKGAPRGAKLLHRRGYNAPRPYVEIPVRDRRIKAAELILGAQDGGAVATDVLAVAVPDAAGRPFVPLLVEADGPSILAGHQSVRADVELYVYAFDADGRAVDYATQTLTFNAEAAAERLQQSGVKFWAYLALPPGEYSARVLVRNSETGAYGVRVIPLRVPDFKAAAGVLSPPLFPEPSQKWLHARAKTEGVEFPYPYLMGGQRFVPAARPVVPSEGSSTICLTGWNLPAGNVEIEPRVFDMDGHAVGGVRLEIEREYPEAGKYSLVGRLETSGLEAGVYKLVTTARAGGSEHESSIFFLVEN